MTKFDVNSLITRKRIFYIVIFAMLIIMFYSTNALIMDPFSPDYPPHIRMAMHYRHILEMDINQFVEQAPFEPLQPGWHVSVLPFYKLWRMLDLSEADSARLGAALLNAIFNTVAIVAISVVFQKRLKSEKLAKFAPLVAIVIFFVGPLYIPMVNPAYYLGQLYSGVWHNPTTQPLKFFLIITFFLIMYLIENRERLQNEMIPTSTVKLRKLDVYFALFSFLLMLSAVYKPSLVIVFVPSLFIYCSIDVVSTRFKSFWFCFKTGLAVLPSCLLLIVQSTILTDLGNSEIIFAPMVIWRHFAPHPLLSLIISLPFPIFTCIIGFKRIFNNKMMFLSLITFIVSVMIFALLLLSPNSGAADFMWGVMISTLLIFVTSFIFFIDEVTRIGIKQTRAKVIAVIGTVLLFTQFVFGGLYFCMMVAGKTSIHGGVFG